jgi:ribosome-binding factor A
VTDVKTSPDLRAARVFVSVLGDPDAREATRLPRCVSAHGCCKAGSPPSCQLKRTPRLEFVYDSTTDRALRVESLLRDAVTRGDRVGRWRDASR